MKGEEIMNLNQLEYFVSVAESLNFTRAAAKCFISQTAMTQQIRALEDPWARQIPIIAMTADAFSENVAECFEAGMNGHIAKPIDMKIVLKEIRRIKEENRA